MYEMMTVIILGPGALFKMIQLKLLTHLIFGSALIPIIQEFLAEQKKSNAKRSNPFVEEVSVDIFEKKFQQCSFISLRCVCIYSEPWRFW